MTIPPRIIGIIQARMGSTRLPGKVLMEAAGMPLIGHQIARLRRSRHLDGLCVATSDGPGDDALAAYVHGQGIALFRGSENDVLDRFYRAALAQRADIIVRFTGDCPLIDPMLVDDLVDLIMAADPALDYASVDVSRYPRGLDAEITRMATLQTAWTEADTDYEREHVMPFLWRRPDRFRLGHLSDPVINAPWRWCVDTPDDLTLVRHLLDHLMPDHPEFGWRDADRLMCCHPEWVAINRDVVQKTLPPELE